MLATLPYAVQDMSKPNDEGLVFETSEDVEVPSMPWSRAFALT